MNPTAPPTSWTRYSRREFLRASALGLAGAALGQVPVLAQFKGERPKQAEGVTVLNPRGRIPVSLIIDDSTCLVNLAHFCIPHFAEVFPQNYKQDWKKLPREIPDSFVREFGEWCAERGIKGKYSCIPYPACVGWLDRDMPGWSKQELKDSVKLVREFMMPTWDIHPEMVTHTWVINPKTGRAFDERSDKYLENWEWSQNKSADELAAYMAFALKVQKNAGLVCEGITTPGGFGNKNRDALARATFQALRDVFNAEIPHYFRHLFTDPKQSVAPRVEFAAGIDTDNPECVVSIIGCTGDWFGGWDGLTRGTVDQFITEDGKGGRLPQVIAAGEPAILVCHWPGIYFNGERVGFNIFKEVVKRLDAHYDHLLWMKNGEIARYWAAKELTRIDKAENKVTFKAPYACPSFTVRVPARPAAEVKIAVDGKPQALKEVAKPLDLKAGTWVKDKDGVRVCFDLPKGNSSVVW
jgi:hypothetical protein